MAATPTKDHVLFLKAPRDDAPSSRDPYVEALVSTGLVARCLSPISFRFGNLDRLHAALVAPSEHSGIVLSSPRVVKAMAESVRLYDTSAAWERVHIAQWATKAIFAIGKATAAAAAAQLSLSSTGENSGNAASLVPEIIRTVKKETLPLLFPCGNLRRETIPKTLADEGIRVNSLTVYETIPAPHLASNFQHLIDTDAVPEFAVYFSPSGVRNTHSVMAQLGFPMDKIKFIAIGPTTQMAMVDKGLPVAAVAEHPTPDCVRDVILSLRSL